MLWILTTGGCQPQALNKLRGSVHAAVTDGVHAHRVPSKGKLQTYRIESSFQQRLAACDVDWLN